MWYTRTSLTLPFRLSQVESRLQVAIVFLKVASFVHRCWWREKNVPLMNFTKVVWHLSLYMTFDLLFCDSVSTATGFNFRYKVFYLGKWISPSVTKMSTCVHENPGHEDWFFSLLDLLWVKLEQVISGLKSWSLLFFRFFSSSFLSHCFHCPILFTLLFLFARALTQSQSYTFVLSTCIFYRFRLF